VLRHGAIATQTPIKGGLLKQSAFEPEKTMSKTKWDRHSIKAALHREGMTLTRLAEINDLNPNRFRTVWNNTHRKAEAAIAKFLNVPVQELFPDRYPIRSSRILSSKYDDARASQKSPAPADIRSAA